MVDGTRPPERLRFKYVYIRNVRQSVHNLGYRLVTGTAAELRLALTINLTVTDTGFAVLTPDPIDC